MATTTRQCATIETHFKLTVLLLSMVLVVPMLFAYSDSDNTVQFDVSNDTVYGDVDGDSDLDLIVANWNQSIRLYRNDGLNHFGPAEEITTDLSNTLAIALCDLDEDGDLDLVTGNISHVNRLYLNDGVGNFSKGSDIANDAHDTYDLAFGDLDGDGDLDLVAGNYAQVNRLYLNDGSGTFDSGRNITSEVHDTANLILGDVDSDGDIDLIAENTESNGVDRLYLNDGSGVFASGIEVHSIAVPQTSSTQEMGVANADLSPPSVIILIPTTSP